MTIGPKPPAVPKPHVPANQHLTRKLAFDAFDVDHYRTKTGSWTQVDSSGVISTLTDCCKSAVSSIGPTSTTLQERQSTNQETYNVFVGGIERRQMSAGYRDVISDMLASTSQDR
ncbi:hypothetical protein TWF788_008256 [Orbilia oligospora]|uniref:Uncharacterized protein n=1 Tax=Orbilia oligospora TaxID=2813651 RepID=A0A7C8U1B7_ORBOL|nr:hypothetical protein TWF788_008256 [Orbilia oligospora]